MVTLQKTVLMLLDRTFQAQVWRAALTSQNISVIGGLSDAHVAEILEQLKKAKIELPDLLLTDLEIRNPYDLCRWCRRYYPSLKIVLISNNQREISSTERRWTIHQGADELLAGFQRENLLSNAITEVSRVLEILECPPLRENALIPAMLSFCRETIAPSSQEQSLSASDIVAADRYSPKQSALSAENPNSLADGNNGVTAISTSTNLKSLSSSKLSLILLWLATILGLMSLSILGLVWWFRLRSPVPQSETAAIVQSESSQADTFAKVESVPTGIFNYDGSTAWSPILKLVNPRIEAVFPQLKLRYFNPIGSQPGSGTGIQMLLDGELDFTLTSRPLTSEEYASAQQRGFGLTQHAVAIDGIAVAVNHSLPLNEITIDQLKQIYLGKVTNWSQLGGSDTPIVLLAKPIESSGTTQFWQKTILNQQAFSSEVNYVYSTTPALRQVKNTPGGIYFASASEIVPQCTVKPLSISISSDRVISPYQNQIVKPEECPQQRNFPNLKSFIEGTYPLTRNLYVVVKHNGGREEKIGAAYVKLLLSEQGQKLVEKAGFVPIQ